MSEFADQVSQFMGPFLGRVPHNKQLGLRFIANGNQVGVPATTVPFGTVWIPSAAGTYSVTAQATDNSGNVTDSAPVTVTVVVPSGNTVPLACEYVITGVALTASVAVAAA